VEWRLLGDKLKGLLKPESFKGNVSLEKRTKVGAKSRS
jgi:hypothetical protein